MTNNTFSRKKTMKKLLSLCLACSFSVSAFADSFRCNGKVVLLGASQAEVISKCGKPVMREEQGYRKSGDDYVKVNTLFFDMGVGKFMKILQFEDGKLKKIENGARK